MLSEFFSKRCSFTGKSKELSLLTTKTRQQHQPSRSLIEQGKACPQPVAWVTFFRAGHYGPLNENKVMGFHGVWAK